VATNRKAGQRAAGRAPSARLLLILAATLAALLVVELARVNVGVSRRDDWPWNVNLLGVPTTASLLVATLLAWIARDQYARSIAPTLRYVSQWVDRPEELDLLGRRCRQVEIRNAGPGTLVVTGIRWHVATGGPTSVIGSIEGLRGLLTELRLEDGRDYVLSNFSAGTALSPGEETLYFECQESALESFTVFDADFAFESLLGDQFSRQVSLLPRPGASNATSRSTASAHSGPA